MAEWLAPFITQLVESDAAGRVKEIARALGDERTCFHNPVIWDGGGSLDLIVIVDLFKTKTKKKKKMSFYQQPA